MTDRFLTPKVSFPFSGAFQSMDDSPTAPVSVFSDYLIEATVYDPGISGTRVLSYSCNGFTSKPTGTPANTYYEPRIVQPGNFTLRMFAKNTTSGESSVGVGEIRLNNSDGVLDALIDYGFDGRTLTFKGVSSADGTPQLITTCTMEQPTFEGDSEIVIRVRDFQASLRVSVQPIKYGGTNVLPNGIDGVSDIQGKPIPRTFGIVHNVTPVAVNTSKLIYQFNSTYGVATAVYDRGVSLIKGADYTNQSDMEKTEPAPGYFRCCPSLGCFRLGANPAGTVTCDAYDVSLASADNTAAQVAKRVAMVALNDAARFNTSDITALDAATSASVGVYVSEEAMVIDILDKVLGSVGAWFNFDLNAYFRMARFTSPSGVPDFTFDNTQYLEMTRLATEDEGKGVPVYKVNLNYDRNHTVQTKSDLAGSIISTLVNTSKWSVNSHVMPASLSWRGTCAANGNVYATSTSDNKLYISSDGKVWTTSTPSFGVGGQWGSVAVGMDESGNEIIVLLNGHASSNTTMGAYSINGGTSWTQMTLPVAGSWTSLSYVNGIFVAVNTSVFTNVNMCMTSANGKTWTVRNGISPTATSRCSGVAFGNGVYVTVTSQNDGTTSIARYSTDAITWNSVILPLSPNTTLGFWYKVVFGNGVFVAVNQNDNGIAISTDGETWAPAYLPISVPPVITFGFINGYFCMAHEILRCTILSTNGIDWFSANSTIPTGAALLPMGKDILAIAKFMTDINGNAVPVVTDNNYAFNLSVQIDRVSWLVNGYRTVTDTDATVKTVHLLAPELNKDSLLVNKTDAQVEATRLLNLYKVRRDMLEVTVSTEIVRFVEIGKTVKIISPRYGYQSGKLFVVIGVEADWQHSTVILTLWG